jgi:hypothetical protein
MKVLTVKHNKGGPQSSSNGFLLKPTERVHRSNNLTEEEKNKAFLLAMKVQLAQERKEYEIMVGIADTEEN